MKIIFLDFDGVLNTEIYQSHFFHLCKEMEMKRVDAKLLKRLIIRDEFGDIFDPVAVKNLSWIVEATDSKIVVSSSWRSMGLQKLKLMWEMRDLPGEIIDITPTFGTVRGEEVMDWLKMNDYDDYIIIDDNTDFLDEQKNKLILTNPTYGLSYVDALKSVELLNKNL